MTSITWGDMARRRMRGVSEWLRPCSMREAKAGITGGWKWLISCRVDTRPRYVRMEDALRPESQRAVTTFTMACGPRGRVVLMPYWEDSQFSFLCTVSICLQL